MSKCNLLDIDTQGQKQLCYNVAKKHRSKAAKNLMRT